MCLCFQHLFEFVPFFVLVPVLTYLVAIYICSDGEHVTLGYFEREDLLCVVAHLRATDVVSTIALWGRSMGAGVCVCVSYNLFEFIPCHGLY